MSSGISWAEAAGNVMRNSVPVSGSLCISIVPAMRLDDLFHKVKSEACAMNLVLDRALSSKERIEDMRSLLDGNAGPIVNYADANRIRLNLSGGNLNQVATIFHRVVNQVLDRLMKRG